MTKETAIQLFEQNRRVLFGMLNWRNGTYL